MVRIRAVVDATTSADVLAIGDQIARRLADEAREAGRVDEAIDALTQGRPRRR
jgi:hypothetical protein